MKKIIAVILAAAGLSATLQAQTLLYQWQFTSSTDTLTNSSPTFAITPGTGGLGMYGNVSGGGGTAAVSQGLIFFTNANAGPPGGPGGALVLNGQAYGNPSDVVTNNNLNLGTLYQLTITFWVQYGASVGSASQLAREVEFGAELGYDAGGKGTGNVNGIGTALNGASTGFYSQFQDGIDSPAAAQQNVQVTITSNPNFANGFVCDGSTWYFEAITYDGTLTSSNYIVWLASTNATTFTGTPAGVVTPFAVNANYGGIPFTTNAALLLAGCTGATRDLSTGQIADVRIYSGVMSSNNLSLISQFKKPSLVSQPLTPASIATQPNSGGTFVGGNRTFGVTALGTPSTFTYLWRSNGVAVTGATNASFTLTNAQLSANGASFICSVTNAIGGTNSTAAVISVVQPGPGTYAQAVFTNNPFSLWLINEATNTSSIVVSDYANGHDGLAVDPANMLFTNGPASPYYSGFPANNTAIEVIQDGRASRLNMPALPVLTNNAMTICGWVYTPTQGTSGDGLIFDLTSDTLPGYGLLFGPNNDLEYQWGNGAASSDSGLSIPSAEWAFVAMVVQTNLFGGSTPDTNVTLYVGSPTTGLNSVLYGTLETGDIIADGTSLALLAFGRTTVTSSENGGFNLASTVAFSDVAVFYKALSPSAITNLYSLGAGGLFPLVGVPDPNVPGNILLTFPMGILQEAGSLTKPGSFTNVSGAFSPWSVPMTGHAAFFRVAQ